MQTLSILIPAYNERPTLLSLLCKVLTVDLAQEGLRKEIVVVDDGSTDGTREIVARLGEDWQAVMAPALRRRGIDPDRACAYAEIVGLLHPENRGKTAALRTGVDAMRGEYAVIQDADLEYDPEDYHRLLHPILNGHADVVYGSRFAGTERRVLLFWHSLGNNLLTTLSNMATNLNLTDMETCYKAFRGDILRNINIESERFGFEPEITIKIAKLGYRIYEVPISYHGRGYDSGKKITWRDGVETLYCIGKYSLSSKVVKENVLEETLEKMSGLTHLNTHMFQTIRPWLGKRIAEAGSGHGNITHHLVSAAEEVIATDLEEPALSRLREAFGEYDNVFITPWDMTRALPLPEGAQPPDTVVCLNVLEHIEDEKGALDRTRELLVPTDGRLVLLVPAHEELFSPLDEQLGHHRRYTEETLRGALERSDFEVEHLQWFNFLGYFGWRLNSSRGGDRLPTGQLALYQAVSPYTLALERKLKPRWGLSLIAVARPR
jgi:glycosyltransferase involved in cell wall biosynthesis